MKYASKVKSRGARLLLADDNQNGMAARKSLLEEQEFVIVTAANGEEAFEALSNGMFNLLVTDVIMPGASGPRLFERLARQRPDLKVLYVSGYTGDTIVHQGELAPGVEFLRKPFTADALNRRVREVLDR